MMIIASSLIIFSSFLLFIASLAFLKARDIFSMTHIAIISNSYVINLLLIAILLNRFSIIAMLKIIGVILLNFLITHIICHTITKRAMINKESS